MQPTEPSFPDSGVSGGTEVAVSQIFAESPHQPSASPAQTMAPAEEVLDVGKADSLGPNIESDSAVGDVYHSTIVEPLKALVSNELPSQEVTEEATQEICRLLIKRLPESACGQEDAIAPIRANLWSAMLLGLRPEDLNRQACAFVVCLRTYAVDLLLAPTTTYCCTVYGERTFAISIEGQGNRKQDHFFFNYFLPPACATGLLVPFFLLCEQLLNDVFGFVLLMSFRRRSVPRG